MKKCQFFQKRVDYLGHVISPGKLSMADATAAAFANATFPTDNTGVRSFLGACNVYRRFVKDFSKIARPMTDMTRKDARPDYENPTEAQRTAFETLKSKLVSPPILCLPKLGKRYILDTDASAYQLGCVLLQEQDDNEFRPVGYWSYSLNPAERNYSATERECYAVVWAITSLRPYIEGTKFNVRTDHDALRWLMSLTDSSGRLTRWRLRLAEFDFQIEYRPGRVHQVPDALSRLITPRVPQNEIDDDVPTFDVTRDTEIKGGRTPEDARAKDASDPKRAATSVLVTTRSRRTTPDTPETISKSTPPRRSERIRTGVIHANDLTNPDTNQPPANESAPVSTANDYAATNNDPIDNEDTNGDHHSNDDTTAMPELTNDEWDDLDDVDPYDLSRVDPNTEPSDLTAIAPIDLPTPISIDELLDAQRSDSFCQSIQARQTHGRQGTFFDDDDGVLRRQHPSIPTLTQLVVPQSIRPRLLTLTHHSLLAGHPGQNRMFYTLRETYYWPHMAADIAATVRNCRHCARNRVRLRRHLHRLKLFPATRPLESVAIDILGPLTKTKSGKRFLLVITDRFTKLTQVVALRTINAYHVAVAFCEAWIFKYGPPKTLLSDNGKQFTSKFFQSVCRLLGLSNIFTSAYHPQTNGQTERYNRTVLAMIRNFVNDNQDDWDRYVTALTYSYNCHVHRSTKTTPFDLVPSRPPPEFSLTHRTTRQRPKTTADIRHDFIKRLDASMLKANESLRRVQDRYKRDFDKRVRRTRHTLKAGDFVFLDPTDGSKKLGKLKSPAIGPYRVLVNDKRTLIIDRDGIVERVSADRCVFAPRPSNARQSLTTTADATTKVTNGPQFVVDKLLDHGENDDGTLSFNVKWVGFRETTWEPRTHIPEELVSRYFERLRQRADPRLPTS